MTSFKLSVRGIRNNLGRLALTVIAITLGVGFVSGSFILSDSLSKVFNGIVDSANANLDARVQVSTDLSFGQLPGTIPDSLAAEIEALDEVAEVISFVQDDSINSFVGLDTEGEPQVPQGPPILTFSWTGPRDGGGFELVEGNPPSGPDSIALSDLQAEALDLSVGDTRRFQTPTGLQEFTLAGIVSFPGGGAWFTLFDLETAQTQLGKEGILDAIAITASEGILPADVIGAIEPLLPAGTEVIDQAAANAADSADFNQFISIFGNVLLGFAAIALFVSLFIIYNTFAILVSQRIQQIGMLRAVGASRGQVRLSVLIEALLVGFVGSAFGLAAGIGVAELIKALIKSQGGFPDVGTIISPRTIIVAFIVGIVATVISALLPAFKAGKISPVEAMRNEGTHESRGRVRILFGALVTAVGLLAVGYGLTGQAGLSGTLTFLGVGAVLTFVGVALLSGLFAGVAVSALGRPLLVAVLGTFSGIFLLLGGLVLTIAPFFGLLFLSGATGELTFPGQDGAEDQVISVPSGAAKYFFLVLAVALIALGLLFLFSAPRAIIDGGRLLRHTFTNGSEKKMVRIARQNAARSPQRTAATATALMIGLALVTLVSVLGASLQASLDRILDSDVGADLFVGHDFDEPLPDELAARLRNVEGIDAVSEYRFGDVRIGGEDGKIFSLVTFEATTGNQILNYGVDDAAFAAVSEGSSVIVSSSAAEDEGFAVGQVLEIEFEDLQTESLTIAAIAENENFLNGGFLMDNKTLARHFPDQPIESIGAKVVPGETPAAVKERALEIAQDYASITVQDNEDFKAAIESGIGAFTIIINGLLGLALVVAFFGVVNTIVLSVLERTREIGLLRAIGMTRGQLMSTIRWEAVMVSLFGTLLGIALGVLFAIAGVRAIPDTIIDSVAIPWATLITIVLMAGLIGVLAAYLPARRAAKLNPLDAIANL